MRIELSSSLTICLSKIGRLYWLARDGFATYQPTGEQLFALLSAECDDAAARAHLRALHAECAAGHDAAPAKSRRYWRESLLSIRDASQRMQGSVEGWGTIFELEQYGSLPSWAVEELGRPSQLNRELRLMYLAGLTTGEAGEQLRALVAAEQRLREFAEVA